MMWKYDLQQTIEIQNLISNNANIELLAKVIKDNMIFQDKSMIIYFIQNLCRFVTIRPRNMNYYISILRLIVSNTEKYEVLREIFVYIQLPMAFLQQVPLLRFLYLSIKEKIYSFHDILNYIDFNNLTTLQLGLLYQFWFSKEIEENHINIDPHTLGIYSNNFKRVFTNYFSKIEKMRENDWEYYNNLRENGITKGLLYTIKCDDIEQLSSCAANPEFDFNVRIKPKYFSTDFFLQNNPTLIQVAAFYGSIKCFNFLRLNNADLHAEDKKSQSLQKFAVAGGNLTILDILDDFSFEDTLTTSVLFHNIEISKWLISVKRVQNMNEAFSTACLNNDFECLNLLLENGVNPNSCNVNASNALHLAAARNNFVVLNFLKDLKINLAARNAKGMTPLNLAIVRNHIESVRTFLEYPYININTSGIKTPLMFACEYGNLDIIDLLIENGADLNLQDESLYAAIHYAVIAKRIDVVKHLIKQDNLDVNTTTNEGWTALHFAAQLGYHEIAEVLLNTGKIENIKDINGNSALDLARDSKRKNCELLISKWFSS